MIDPLALLEIVAWQLHGAVIGGGTPYLNTVYERLKNPKPGDLVLETTTFLNQAENGKRIGRLIRIERTESETVYYVRMLYCEQSTLLEYPNETRWTNARFVAIPESIHAYTTQSLPR